MTEKTHCEETFRIENQEEQIRLFGAQERFLKKLRSTFDVQLAARDGVVLLKGNKERVGAAKKALSALHKLVRSSQQALNDADVSRVLSQVDQKEPLPNFAPIPLLDSRKTIVPKTAGQLALVRAIQTHDITFCIGPAGTGKTFLAAAMALNAMGQGSVRKIVLARPAVEAGEKLGFLPGDLYEKVNPYLRPLHDAMEDLVEMQTVNKLIERGLVEIVPLAFMRGRTLDRAFVILDEAQNATVKQMMMFLTRLGPNAKAVVAGDATQTDLALGEVSGLADAQLTLAGIPGIAFVDLAEADVVRHPLVREIVKAYGKRQAEKPTAPR